MFAEEPSRAPAIIGPHLSGNACPSLWYTLRPRMTAQSHISLSAAFLLASMCAPIKTQDPSPPPPPPTQQQTESQQPPADTPAEVIGKQLIPDFAGITSALYRGGQPRKHGFEALAKMGI